MRSHMGLRMSSRMPTKGAIGVLARRRKFDLVEGVSSSADLLDALLGGLVPDERIRVVVVLVLGPSIGASAQERHRSESSRLLERVVLYADLPNWNLLATITPH